MGLLYAEKHRTRLRQPVRLNRRDALHVLLAGHHQLVVYDVVGGVPEAVQRRRRVQVTGHAVAAVDVLADTLQPRRLMEIGGTERTTAEVPVASRADELDLLRFHDIE